MTRYSWNPAGRAEAGEGVESERSTVEAITQRNQRRFPCRRKHMGRLRLDITILLDQFLNDEHYLDASQVLEAVSLYVIIVKNVPGAVRVA
jgi:hypothetical protein